MPSATRSSQSPCDSSPVQQARKTKRSEDTFWNADMTPPYRSPKPSGWYMYVLSTLFLGRIESYQLSDENNFQTCPESSNPGDGLGVCLWAGAGGNSNGWVNQENKSNCGKQIYIQRKGDAKNPHYAKVIGGCDFGPNIDETVGCFNIAVNEALFEKLNPTEAERKDGALCDVTTWDFNNLKGTKPENASY
ncbi:hypothetical protein PtA15_5A136 [Puccinia triticina]|uniref:Uncharacterized protein n=1 Tax=Puccinia triticina TaxID=208348 RepID=A0ABY7CKA7_9BASI|nr:uncharacterized protein PtA15_5A136 [Puccinia triticina]WAQ84566.1 hypothetical protein PtA15_5A136 [Puccinia triticina]WAR57910.1 hypothetical protein PtB15_5B140 [Puccinia triticina]